MTFFRILTNSSIGGFEANSPFSSSLFIAPAGFSLRKQLSHEALEKMRDDIGSCDDSDFLERAGIP
jgi:hypothetical protein